MEKSKHNYTISSGIPTSELTNFINPINMSLKVDTDSFNKLFVCYGDVIDYINEYFKYIMKYIPSMVPYEDNFIHFYCSISYVPHTSGYDFRFSPIDFYNSLFLYMDLPYQIPFINLDNGFGMNYLNDYVKAYINDFKRDESQKLKPKYDIKLAILEELESNLSIISNAMYCRNLDNIVNNRVVAKNMLLYLANKSLSQYERTHDEKYMILPYEYYHYVSHMQTSPYPHNIRFEDKTISWTEFRGRYESMFDPSIQIDETRYLLDDHEVLLAWDILKPGMLDRELRDVCARTRAESDVDYEKYRQLFELKMNYYMNSPYVKYIKGKYGLLGYVGFSYMNDYLLFDKFHNSDTIDPSKKTILTHGEAIYALPADRFDVIRGSKQRVIAAKESDHRIKKINHTPNNSFIGKLDNIIHGPNVSTLTFDEALENTKKKILINKNHSN